MKKAFIVCWPVIVNGYRTSFGFHPSNVFKGLNDAAFYPKIKSWRRQRMTDRDKLPVKATTGYVIVPTEQSGSLVARGLEAFRNRQISRGGNLGVPSDPLHEIEMHEVSEEFERCWNAACRHIQKQVQSSLHIQQLQQQEQGHFFSWLKSTLIPPFLEHMSFRLGNQLFYIRIEDVDGRLDIPGSRDGLLSIAEGCKGHPCIMQMRHRAGGWTPDATDWGLIDARTGMTVDPVAQVSDERIEMTDWELQDFAVQIVRDHLKKAGRTLMSWQSRPAVHPSIWFVGNSGPEWVVVRVVRYPDKKAELPANWQQIAARYGKLRAVGHFASVSVANAVLAEPLWRGHKMNVRFAGLLDPDAV
jgi:hypothetical protein